MKAQDHTQEIVNTTGNVTAVGTAVGTLAGWLPSIAALFTIVWLGVQIYESKTGQRVVTYIRGKKEKPQ